MIATLIQSGIQITRQMCFHSKWYKKQNVCSDNNDNCGQNSAVPHHAVLYNLWDAIATHSLKSRTRITIEMPSLEGILKIAIPTLQVSTPGRLFMTTVTDTVTALWSAFKSWFPHHAEPVSTVAIDYIGLHHCLCHTFCKDNQDFAFFCDMVAYLVLISILVTRITSFIAKIAQLSKLDRQPWLRSQSRCGNYAVFHSWSDAVRPPQSRLGITADLPNLQVSLMVEHAKEPKWGG